MYLLGIRQICITCGPPCVPPWALLPVFHLVHFVVQSTWSYGPESYPEFQEIICALGCTVFCFLTPCHCRFRTLFLCPQVFLCVIYLCSYSLFLFFATLVFLIPLSPRSPFLSAQFAFPCWAHLVTHCCPLPHLGPNYQCRRGVA